MDFFKRINTKAKTVENTGFGTNSNSYGGRFINKDGTANIQRRGLNFFERTSFFHTLIEMSRLKFLLIIVGFYIVINFIFALLYYLIGLEYLSGIDSNGSNLDKFGKAYFFRLRLLRPLVMVISVPLDF
jgi:inward rectifier potassium channel